MAPVPGGGRWTWRAVADDLTGAADLAGNLARPGRPVHVAGQARALRGLGGSVVLDAATRFMPPAAARLASQRAWRQLPGAAGRRLSFQKIDSTLRGNPGAEIEGLLLASQAPWVAVLPAYPSLGRSVLGGRVRVHGLPLMRSEYARDPLSPARIEAVPALFPPGLTAHAGLAVVKRGPAALRAWLLRRPRRARFITFDCVEDGHVRVIADACLRAGGRHFAGASALGAALARGVDGEPSTPRAPRLPWFLVVGSVSESAFSQLRLGSQAGAFLWVARRTRVGGRWVSWTPDQRAVLAASLRRGGAVALSSLGRRGDLAAWRALGRKRGLTPDAVARVSLRDLAAAALKLGGSLERRLWFLAGGHTLASFFSEAGLERLEVLGSLRPGVQLSRAHGPGGGAWIASRPGGFGGPDDLLKLLERQAA